MNQVLLKFSMIFIFILSSSFANNKTSFYNKEKIYIHFDKPNYYAGEDIWFKVYLVNAATHRPETLSQLVYVELIDPGNKIIETKTIKIIEGGGAGDFKLSVNLISGKYRVRAYTNFMRNFDPAYFFRKGIYIQNLKENPTGTEDSLPKNIDVQFFPEGGFLVSDLLNRIGFKALDESGKGVDIEGTITDKSGKEILRINTSKFGMGLFELAPKKNELYQLSVNLKGVERQYDLPKPLEQGAVMQVIERDKEYRIYLQSTLETGLHSFSFIASQRKGPVIEARISGNESKALVKVPKNMLKQGIVEFTLFDNNDQPILERLAFYDTVESEVSVNIMPSTEVHETRELVKIEISLDSTVQPTIPTNLSIAVTDRSTVKTDPYGIDIESELLLNSELKGNIEQPGYYFYSDEPERKRNLDILMMTQGWRQFILNDTIKIPSNPRFPAESGFRLSGTVKSLSNHKKPVTANVSLTYNNSEEFAIEEVKTDQNGKFIFNQLNFMDTTSVLVQAKKLKKGKQRKSYYDPTTDVLIEMDAFTPPGILVFPEQNSQGFIEDLTNSNSTSHKYLESIYEMQQGAVKLDEVVLEAESLNKNDHYNKKRVLYKDPSHTFDFKENDVLPTNNTLSAIQGRLPGVSVRNNIVYIRGPSSFLGDNSALLLVDGIVIANDGTQINAISVFDIDFIDVLKGPRAAIYGSRAANGVVAVYTKNGTESSDTAKNRRKRGALSFVHAGYSMARKFYQPVYGINQKEESKFDYRPTLYWNPTISFDENGKSTISFYTSDATSPYQIVLEGITFNGQIIKKMLIINR